MFDTLQLSDFSAWLNQQFAIRFTPEVTLPAVLVEINEFPSQSPESRKPFSLIFRTEQKTQYYQQAIFGIIHPEKGELPVFMAPLGLDEHGMRYEAVFN